MRQMRNQPSTKTGKVDTIDRHTKGRLLVIDATLLFTQGTQDWAMLLVDIAEISDYYDTLVVCKPSELEYTEAFCEHWGLQAEVAPVYTKYEELLPKYRTLLAIANKNNGDKFKKYYHAETIVRC